jgi:hypothetical protein
MEEEKGPKPTASVSHSVVIEAAVGGTLFLALSLE